MVPFKGQVEKPSPNSHPTGGRQLSAPGCPADGKRGLCSQLQDADSPGTCRLCEPKRARPGALGFLWDRQPTLN